ncbi:hypothetical protein QDG88_14025 [Pseudoalteromonas piscicida]|uniref:hypothetical protein n=1 Tax=Pseudoalteromonas piscicida TaxID=43662 RepID=UPI00273A4CCB|nr:hypothetical protein [Pseudoalteromonas piscicida]MDP4489037.1 hypothetical protein [Pseudoalteromonas piscicida]
METRGVEINSKEEKKDFFFFLKSTFAIDGNLLLKDYLNVQKLAWEQLLLLFTYCRQRAYNHDLYNDCDSFRAKMRLIKLVEDVCAADDKEHYDIELMRLVLETLDDGLGIVKLTERLISKNDTTSENTERLLYQIELQRISFPGKAQFSPNHCIESHYMMYVALYKPFEAISPLLMISQLSEVRNFEKLLISTIQVYVREKNPHRIYEEQATSTLLNEVNEIDDISTLKEFISRNEESIDYPEIRNRVVANAMDNLASCASNSFDKLFFKAQKKHFYDRKKTISQEIFGVEKEEKHIKLSIKKSTLEDLINLGQIDAILDSVKVNLERQILGSNVNRRMGQHIDPSNYTDSLTLLSIWYQKCGTSLFRKFEDIPRLIASVLIFDIKNKVGAFSEEPYLIQKNLSNKELALFSKEIIKNCLHRNISLNFFLDIVFNEQHFPYGNDGTEDNIEKKLENAKNKIRNQESYLFPNTFMERWAKSEDTKATLERIKKLFNFEKNGKRALVANTELQEQRAKAHKCKYPLLTHYPLPLWANIIDE